MRIKGIIKKKISERTGNGANGEWKVATYLLETVEMYPNRVVFEVFGSDRIAQLNLQEGSCYEVSYKFDAHEYNGAWYNRVRAYGAELVK